MDPGAAFGGVEVVGHLLEAGDGLGREPSAQRDDERVVGEVAGRRDDDPVVEIERLGFGVQELDSLLLQPVQWSAELARSALAHHLPQHGWLVDVVGCAVDEHDPVVGREPVPELACSHEPAGTSAQDDGAANRPGDPARGRRRRGGALDHLLDRVREARLVELVLREDHLAVRPHENAPGHPAVGQCTEQRPVTVGDHGKIETVLLLPGGAGFLGLDRADVDDLEPVAGESLDGA